MAAASTRCSTDAEVGAAKSLRSEACLLGANTFGLGNQAVALLRHPQQRRQCRAVANANHVEAPDAATISGGSFASSR